MIIDVQNHITYRAFKKHIKMAMFDESFVVTKERIWEKKNDSLGLFQKANHTCNMYWAEFNDGVFYVFDCPSREIMRIYHPHYLKNTTKMEFCKKMMKENVEFIMHYRTYYVSWGDVRAENKRTNEALKALSNAKLKWFYNLFS